MECRANERLKPENVDIIKVYYREISKFWPICDVKAKIEVASTFRCIVNCGIDPTILKVDIVPWETDGTKTQVNDQLYLHTLLRESGTIDAVVEEFLYAMSVLKENIFEDIIVPVFDSQKAGNSDEIDRPEDSAVRNQREDEG